MGKRKKSTQKRSQRRERAKLRADGLFPDDEIEVQEEAADAAVRDASKAKPEEQTRRTRERKPPKEDSGPNAWDRLKLFFTDVKIEAKKINWPAIDETWKSTWVTVIFILMLALFMGVASIGFQKISEALFSVDASNRGIVTDVPAPPGTSLGAVGLDDQEDSSSSDTGAGGTQTED